MHTLSIPEKINITNIPDYFLTQNKNSHSHLFKKQKKTKGNKENQPVNNSVN